MSRDLQQQRDQNQGSQAGAEVDVDAEHKPEVARRASNASLRREVQKKGAGDANAEHVHAAAERGTASKGKQLPHLDKIQAAFGNHDVSNIEAHVDGESTRAMGAEAYATGNHVVFDREPDLHTAAHEAAHVVQQKEGVQLKGGVGAAGDSYERRADEIADRVVQGKSAGDLLGAATGNQAQAGAVQQKAGAKPLDAKAAHQAAESKSYDSVQSAFKHLSKEFHSWVPQLQDHMNANTSGPAGAEPAVQAITAIYEMAMSDATRLGELIGTANKNDARTLGAEVKQVQGAAFIFVNHMRKAAGWVQQQAGHQSDKLDVMALHNIVQGYTAKIGIDGEIDQDRKAPEGDEKTLTKSLVDDEVEALEAAIVSVEAGNDEDSRRITIHARYLDNFAKDHSLRIKSHRPKLKELKTKLDAIRGKSPGLNLNEASNHLKDLIEA